MLGNGVEISLIFRRVLGPLVLGWAPNPFILGAQLAHGEKRLVCIPENMWPPGQGHFFQQGDNLIKLGKGPQGDSTYQISRL